MTPQERDLIDKLFDKLSGLESNPRDNDAEQAIAAGLARAPHAIYALVQTVLVQDEALKQADQEITALEAKLNGETEQPAQEQQGSFLGAMRDAVLGRSAPQRSAVPAAGGASRSVWGNAPGYTQPGNAQPNPGNAQPNDGQPGYAATPPASYPAAPQVGYGGSFLGTAAAAAAGMVGGSLLMNSFRSMFGGAHNPQAFAQDYASQSGRDRSPLSDASNSDLAQQAGVNDIGGAQDSGNGGDGLLDSTDSTTEDVYDTGDSDDGFDGGDDGFDGGDDSDYA